MHKGAERYYHVGKHHSMEFELDSTSYREAEKLDFDVGFKKTEEW